MPAPATRRRPARTATAGWVVVLLVGLSTLGAAVGYLYLRSPGISLAAVPGRSVTPPPPIPTPSPTPTPSATLIPVPSYARNGPGTYVLAGGTSPVFGTAGELRRYHVEVETGSPVSAADFAAVVDATLADPRSWIAGMNIRLQRVPRGTFADFAVMLVTPGTAQKLCMAVGLDIIWKGEPYTSCQAGPQAVINLARYLTAVPGYGAPLLNYQEYAINHEVGHVLGHGHELCPGKGRPAPVMQQQTFGLQGCVANSWPYLNGRRYAGPPGRIVPQA